jgi:amidase
MKNSTPLLQLCQLNVAYETHPVLRAVNLNMDQGNMHCIIGEEGVGKSTILKALTGQIDSAGVMIFKGADLRRVPTHKMTQTGIDFIMQGGNILPTFTVAEHIDLAFRHQKVRGKEQVWKEIDRLFPRLRVLQQQVGGRLSGGERMMLSFACLLATDSELLVLDEPTVGLAPAICQAIGDFLLLLKQERGKTILLLEHNYDFAFSIVDTVSILQRGQLSQPYYPADFKDEQFIDQYLFQSTFHESINT